jgi:hypothetical protein
LIDLQSNTKTMKITEFNERFPDEHSCRMDMKNQREKVGVVCKRCGGKQHYWFNTIYQWSCMECKFRTTLRSGTVMHDSKLPVRTWYLCMAYMGMTKKAISAHEMRRQLGMKRYEPVWAMMRKIRKAMGQRDAGYGLEDMVELDEGYFPQSSKAIKLKRGKGSQRKRNVVVMAESTPLEDIETGKKSSQCRFFKMKVIDSGDAQAINDVVRKNIAEKTIVLSDKATNYVDIAKYIEGHVTVISDKNTTNDTLRWVHTAISNAKRMLLGIYHQIRGVNLQLYLDEFCYKLNRRYFGDRIFDRITVAIASSKFIQAD